MGVDGMFNLIQQLEAAAIFGAFFTRNALQRFTFHAKWQDPAEGIVGFSTQ
ncbi:Uncharacterised protein [Leclercia adecarboxylata]|uniref:Uncharacterized protein n=1 Tax=Leclercia adecarboxylata TaxID=83655 RepID=A0A4V6YY02_9ENTR|nr:Uncharacterised protein [Leclercia adecarboxylata]